MEVFEIETETKVRLRLNGKDNKQINNKLETEYLVLVEQPGLVNQNK